MVPVLSKELRLGEAWVVSAGWFPFWREVRLNFNFVGL